MFDMENIEVVGGYKDSQNPADRLAAFVIREVDEAIDQVVALVSAESGKVQTVKMGQDEGESPWVANSPYLVGLEGVFRLVMRSPEVRADYRFDSIHFDLRISSRNLVVRNVLYLRDFEQYRNPRDKISGMISAMLDSAMGHYRG